MRIGFIGKTERDKIQSDGKSRQSVSVSRTEWVRVVVSTGALYTPAGVVYVPNSSCVACDYKTYACAMTWQES